MKKFFVKMLSCAVATVLALFVLNGCALITTNTERDMNQVIATVAVDDVLKEDVYKRELVSAFNSQGYYYVQYQGMAQKEVYEMMLEDIIKNRILKQQAIISLVENAGENKGGYFALAQAEANKSSYDKVLSKTNYLGNAFTTLKKADFKDTDGNGTLENLDKLMTEYEYYAIQYKTLASIKALIDGYVDVEEDEHDHGAYEIFQGQVRTAPTQPSEVNGNEWEMENDEEISAIDKDGAFFKEFSKLNEDEELGLNLDGYTSKYELAFNVYKTYYNKYDSMIAGNRVEITKIVKDLKNLGYISEAEASKATPLTKNELLSLTYFKDALAIQYENMLIEKYKLALQNNEEKKLAGPEGLYAAYVNAYNTQKNKFDASYESYETALENASDSNLVLYHPTASEGKYGYVLNLLIGFNDEQTAILTAIDESVTLTKDQRDGARDALLATLTAKDLRSSWVESNYGAYDKDSNSFTFSDNYCKTKALKKFEGSIICDDDNEYTYHDSYDNEVVGWYYDVVSGNEIAFNDFYTKFMSVMTNNPDLKDANFVDFNKDKDNAFVEFADEDVTYDRFMDLIFAYSTDNGSLSSTNGYVYSPNTSATKYVKEFAAAAKELVAKGAGYCTVVATDYGYHILLCTEVIEPTSAEVMDFETFKTQLAQEDTIPYRFKEYQKTRLVIDNVDKITNKFFNDNLAKATYYTETYEDLLA